MASCGLVALHAPCRAECTCTDLLPAATALQQAARAHAFARAMHRPPASCHRIATSCPCARACACACGGGNCALLWQCRDGAAAIFCRTPLRTQISARVSAQVPAQISVRVSAQVPAQIPAGLAVRYSLLGCKVLWRHAQRCTERGGVAWQELPAFALLAHVGGLCAADPRRRPPHCWPTSEASTLLAHRIGAHPGSIRASKFLFVISTMRGAPPGTLHMPRKISLAAAVGAERHNTA
eukprot:359446-Chlamydomonas_euryale.AAC.4